MTDTTHYSTLEAQVRKIANSCDLGGLNADFFLKSTFVSEIASLIRQHEEAAVQRGILAAQSK